MAWTAPRTWVAAETVTAALLNTHIRDNQLASPSALVTTAGDLVYASGANAFVRLGVGATSQFLGVSGGLPTWVNSLTGGLNLGAGSGAGTGQLFQSGSHFIGSAYTNTKMTLGLTINQGSADDDILTFKSSDVAHGVTGVAETDTYARFAKYAANDGGLQLQAIADTGTTGLALTSIAPTDDTTKSTAAIAGLLLTAYKTNGTSVQAVGANGNLVAINNGAVTRFILDSDGDSHQDVGTAWTNFDDHDDSALLTALSVAVSKPGDPVREKFLDVLETNRDSLERADIVSFNDDGHHFVNMSRLTMVLVGAVRQLSDRSNEQSALIADMRRLLPTSGDAR